MMNILGNKNTQRLKNSNIERLFFFTKNRKVHGGAILIFATVYVGKLALDP